MSSITGHPKLSLKYSKLVELEELVVKPTALFTLQSVNFHSVIKDAKELVKSENCMREKLYWHFQESVSCKEPGHDCCSLCRKNCQCSIDGSCEADKLVDSLTPHRQLGHVFLNSCY